MNSLATSRLRPSIALTAAPMAQLPSGLFLAGVKLATPGELKLNAGQGDLALNLIQTTKTASLETVQSDLVIQKAKGQGSTSTDAAYNDLAYGKLTIKSPDVTVQQASTAGVNGALTPASLSELGSKPGMGWIADVQRQQAELARTNPAAALHIENVKLAHEQWNYKQQGLTPEGAVIVAAVVAYFTAGAGSSLVGAISGTAVAVGVTQAAVTTLATQASISLINNQGNLGATLKELGSKESVKALATAMVTGGVMGGMNFSPTGQPTAGGGAQSFTHQLGQNLQAGIARSLISTAINGGSLQDSLKGAITTAFIDTGAAQGAFAIGNMKDAGTLDAFTHKLAHALAGCAAGAARAGGDGCAPGAIGAALGEISAEAYGRKSDTVEFAAMISGIGAALAGGDASQISLASAAGANAAANNRMLHPTEIQRIKELAGKDAQKEARLTAAACAMARCYAEYPEGTAAYNQFKTLADAGASDSFASERELLKSQAGLFTYSTTGLFSDTNVDAAKQFNNTYQIGTRALGAGQATLGAVAIGGSVVTAPASCVTGVGCVANAFVIASGADAVYTGSKQVVSGQSETSLTSQAFQSLGMSPEAATYVEFALGVGASAKVGQVLNSATNQLAKANNVSSASYKDFTTQGIKTTPEVMASPQAQAIVAEIRAANPSMPTINIERLATEWIESGTAMPAFATAAPGSILIKIVPKGEGVATYSPYWMTPQQARAVGTMTPEQAGAALGLPAKQAAQILNGGADFFAITPKLGATPKVFVSDIAPTAQGGYVTAPNAQQVIVPNRSLWNQPVSVNPLTLR